MISTLPADLIFCHGSSWVSSAIRWATQSRGEAKTYANHVGGIVSPGLVLEALWTVVEHPLADLDPAAYQVWRLSSLTENDRYQVAMAALGYKGRAYGGAKILTHLGDALLSKVFGGSPFFFRRLAHRDEYPICSWVWAEAYNKALGYWFGVIPSAASPDDMHDFVSRKPEWEQVQEAAV